MTLRAFIAAGTLLLFGCSDQPETSEAETTESVKSQAIKVESPDAFNDAMSKSKPGQVIVLSDGEWKDFNMVVRGQGTAEEPISVVAETPGEVVLTGQSSLRLGGE